MDLRSVFDNARSQVGNHYGTASDRLLDRMGLEHKRSTMEVVLPAIGIFAAGVTVGALLGVLFAPKRGEEIRGDVRHKLEDLREKGTRRYEELRSTENAIDEATG